MLVSEKEKFTSVLHFKFISYENKYHERYIYFFQLITPDLLTAQKFTFPNSSNSNTLVLVLYEKSLSGMLLSSGKDILSGE